MQRRNDRGRSDLDFADYAVLEDDEPITTPMLGQDSQEWFSEWERRRVSFALLLASSTLIVVMVLSLIALAVSD